MYTVNEEKFKALGTAQTYARCLSAQRGSVITVTGNEGPCSYYYQGRKVRSSEQCWWSGNYSGMELWLFKDDAHSASHQGQCDADVAALRRLPYVAAQVEAWPVDSLKTELGEYGAWDDEQLANHQENIDRMLWIAAGDISEESR